MNDERAWNYIIVWKTLAFSLVVPIFIRVLHVWLPEPVSWGLSMFLSFVLYYETPPRLRVGTFYSALLYSAAGGLMAGIGAYLSGR
jgi:hypothetical protein